MGSIALPRPAAGACTGAAADVAYAIKSLAPGEPRFGGESEVPAIGLSLDMPSQRATTGAMS